MRRTSIVIALVIAGLLFAGMGTGAAQGYELTSSQVITFASHSTGTSWYVYAAGMAPILRAGLPAGSIVDVLPYAAALGNIELVSTGEANIGFTFGPTGAWAYTGTVLYDEADPSLRAIAGNLDTYYLGILLRKDFADRYGISTLGDLLEKKPPVRIVTGPPGSLSEAQTRIVLQVGGYTYDDVRSWGGSVTHIDIPTAGVMTQEGRADLFSNPLTVGHPTYTEIALRTDVIFPAAGDALVEALAPYGFAPGILPGGSFRGQDEDVSSLRFSTLLIARDDMDDAVAYALARALAEGADEMTAIHAALDAYDPETTWTPAAVGGLPLHPGALAYYEEAGWKQ